MKLRQLRIYRRTAGDRKRSTSCGAVTFGIADGRAGFGIGSDLAEQSDLPGPLGQIAALLRRAENRFGVGTGDSDGFGHCLQILLQGTQHVGMRGRVDFLAQDLLGTGNGQFGDPLAQCCLARSTS